MSIKVKLQDGNAEVGGDFNAALSFVKGLPGRHYDAASKTWTVDMPLVDFLSRCSLPCDYSGAAYKNGRVEDGHRTRYGNHYSRNEWDARRDADKAERDARAPLQDAVDEAKRALRDAQIALLVEAAEGNAEAAQRLHAAFVAPMGRCYDMDVAEAESLGLVRFTSSVKRQRVTAAIEAAREHPLHKAVDAAEQAQDDAGENARLSVYEAAGLE